MRPPQLPAEPPKLADQLSSWEMFRPQLLGAVRPGCSIGGQQGTESGHMVGQAYGLHCPQSRGFTLLSFRVLVPLATMFRFLF